MSKKTLHKLVWFLSVVFGGAILTTVVDHSFGIELGGIWARAAHQLVYMSWGAGVLVMLIRIEKIDKEG